MKKIVVPGLAIYALVAGLGLFLRPDVSSLLLIPWLVGFTVLAFTLSYVALFVKDRSYGFPFIILGAIGLNFLIQMTGGPHSPLFPFYFLLTSVAAFQHRAWAYPVAGLILAVEALNLVLSGHDETGHWQVYAGFAASLAGVAFITSHITHRIKSEAQVARDSYDKLISDADAVDPLAGGTNVEALTEKKRQATHISVARQREGAFSALIDMISGIVPAHTYALFLDDHDEGIFSLRGIRSQTNYISPASVTFELGNGLIGFCAARNEPQYMKEMVISQKSIGYYSREVPIKSFLAIPIPQGDRVAGVLVVDSLEYDAFPPKVQETLTRFIPFFGQIIEKIRISLEMEIRANNFAALHDMSGVLNSSLDISEVLNKLTTQIRSVVPYDFCAFVLYDEKNKQAVLTALRGYENRYVDYSFPFDPDNKDSDHDNQSAIMLNMYKQWKMQGFATVHYDPDLGDRGRHIGLFPDKGLQQPIKSLYGRPLIARDKFIGVVFLSSVRVNAFTDYHLHFMGTLLNHVSMVVDNNMLHKRIHELAHTDGLTGLLNHRTFMDKLDEEFKRLDRDSQPFSLLLLDIDFFKKVNDEYGHPVGDVALKCVAGVIRDMARNVDFVARYGGEEFAVGMVGADAGGARQMAERIRKAVENTEITAGKINLKRTLSIGVATHRKGCNKKEVLISQADQALYHAKHSGRNCVSTYADVESLAMARTKEER